MKAVIGFKGASEKMEKELSERFDCILNTRNYKFQVIYIVASVFDPRYTLSLDDAQKEAAKEKILHLVSNKFF